MKKILSMAFVLVMMFALAGCDQADPDYIPGEVSLENPKLDLDEFPNKGCLITYGSLIVGENLPAGDREWEGYHKLGNQKGKVPTRMSFSSNGNIKMYNKPTNIEDWELVKDFNVDRIRVITKDKNIDDIITFPKALNYCLFEDTKENADKDYPCFTLYPEGSPIMDNSPFNIKVCVDSFSSIRLDMLKHTFYLSN